jgi:RNA polymerase sigma-70 factor (ECF subfamily)
VAFEDTFSETHATTPGPVLDARLLVSSLLDELTPPLRAALVLRELEELSYEEIAAMLEIPVGTVRSRLSAARTRFRQLYEAVQEESNHV